MKRLLVLSCILFISANNAFSYTKEEKIEIVQRVYNKMYAAVGTHTKAPKLVFDTRGASRVAKMGKDRDGRPYIAFESKAFDICEQMGDRMEEAIAVLLGHEIKHHTCGHHWGDEFGSAFCLSALEKEIENLDDSSAKKNEIEADVKGGVLCYLAGYNIQGLGEILLPKIYQDYGFKDNPNYPSLNERIELSRQRDSIVYAQVKVLEAGNYAMLVGDLDLAIKCYEYAISKEFHSETIYNNLGIAYFLKGASIVGPEKLKYLYPIEIDMSSRMEPKGSKGFGENEEALFKEALKHFDDAIGFNKKFTTAIVNKACVFNVLGEYEDAVYWAGKARKYADKKSNSYFNAQLILAIAHWEDSEGDKEECEKLFEQLLAKKHLLSEINYKIKNGESLEDMKVSIVPIGWMNRSGDVGVESKKSFESIAGWKSYDYQWDNFKHKNFSSELKIEIGKEAFIYCGVSKDHEVSFSEDAYGDYIGFHATREGYQGATKLGLKFGATEEEIIKLYGMPSSIISSQHGEMLCYHNSRVVFFTNTDNKLEKWMVWRKLD